MGKQGAIRESERMSELFILVMFSIYQMGAAGSFIMYGWSEWIAIAIVAIIVLNWLVFWAKKTPTHLLPWLAQVGPKTF